MARLARVSRVLRDPWTLLASGLAGGATWAIGLPVAGAGLVVVGSLAVAGAIAVATRGSQDAEEPSLKSGTEQSQLIETLDDYCANLRRLSGQQLAPELSDAAANALSVAESSRLSAAKVARAVDILDEGLRQGSNVRSYTASGMENVRATVDRMSKRRTGLLDKLRDAVDQVAQIYTQLLELSTTVSTLDVSVDSGTEVTAISDSLGALQQTFTELEHDAAAVRAGTQL
jgi:hypothetical protein